jgi:hypothetical protein
MMIAFYEMQQKAVVEGEWYRKISEKREQVT